MSSNAPPLSVWSGGKCKCGDFMTSFISWNCRGLRTRLDDLKSLLSTYKPACVALQETFLISPMTLQVRGYNCVRRDVDGDTSPNGGACLFTSHLYPSNVITLHTSLQAAAVRIHVHSLVTVCCVYLPPNDVVPQVDLNHLVSQLPAPFILLGDFNGHSPLWGHDVTNSRGRQIEQLISDHCLCLLNNDEKTYFHAPTRTIHSLNLAICSPTLLPMLNFKVANDLHNSDHFPLLVSYVNGAGTRFRPPTYHFHRADWDKFTRLSIITGKMVQNRAVDEAVFNVTKAIRNAADAAIPRTSNSPRKLCKPWWNASCQQAKKGTKEGVGQTAVQSGKLPFNQANCRSIRQTAINNIVKWCDNNGHSISASKSCCVHFCRKRGIHPDPEIRIRAVQISVVPDVRFLGVIFDRRLTFLPHILQLRKRCEKSLNLLKVLSNTSWEGGQIEHHYSERISKSTVAPVVFQRVFAYHRSKYSSYSTIYTDGSKRADYVGCGVVIEDILHGYRLDTSCSIFTAEAVAIYRELQLIDSNMPRKYCIYTDSMSVLEALENYNDRCHPVVCKILEITSRLYGRVSISCFAGCKVT
ncbi:putative RNA-directed DNA polymerase from transposon X-element [Trichonephila clavipes]|nr:putative RNA-directed DNA polymerase from transposon X-element [Trichonephila clavipes]